MIWMADLHEIGPRKFLLPGGEKVPEGRMRAEEHSILHLPVDSCNHA